MAPLGHGYLSSSLNRSLRVAGSEGAWTFTEMHPDRQIFFKKL